MIYGVHTKTAGDLPGTPARAHKMGANALQFFAGSPRTFKQPSYDLVTAEAFRAASDEIDMPTFIHMMYLTAYGTPDSDLRAKSVAAARQTMVNAEALGVSGVITHMGSHKGRGLSEVMPVLVRALQETIEPVQNGRLLLEISAGSGGNIGNSIEELAEIYEALKRDERIGFCLDTAHLLAAGYDIRTADGWDSLLSKFDDLIGLENLPVLHLNDSKTDLNSKRDRHENIGAGFIGDEGFRVILNDPRVAEKVGILEVPGMDGKGPDAANLEKLKALTN